MIYENEIPDYALLPAKEACERVIVPASKGAIYSPVQVTNITEKSKTTITIEEDILVPDTKPDLREILLIDGRARLSTREVDQISKNDDYINLSGEIEIQTLYLPEKTETLGPIISVQTRVPFKDQWHTGLCQGSTMIMECKAEKIDYMVINERKYRVKILLAIYAREYSDSKVDIFEEIKGEELQMLKEKVEITNVALRKKDTLSLREDIELKDEWKIENILKQDIYVMENYKQASVEKVVINGFVLINILYCTDNRDGINLSDNIRQLQEKVEFTQFIPIQQSGQWSGSNISFDGSDLKVKLMQDEVGNEVLRLEGEIVTYVELYKNTEKDLIIDGYHKEKDFMCDFKEEPARTLVGTCIGEASLREIISPDNFVGDVDGIIYTTGEILSAESRSEQGKVITEGKILAKMICHSKVENMDEEGSWRLFSVKEEVPFRVVTSVPQITGGENISHRINIKDLWAEKINGKQIEFNAAVVVTAEIMRKVPLKVLINPAFEEGGQKKQLSPMVVYIAKEGDSIWGIAKKFKTTTESIIQLNEIEKENLVQGQKLLIIK